jgi:hypothetical protein
MIQSDMLYRYCMYAINSNTKHPLNYVFKSDRYEIFTWLNRDTVLVHQSYEFLSRRTYLSLCNLHVRCRTHLKMKRFLFDLLSYILFLYTGPCTVRNDTQKCLHQISHIR